MCGYDGEGHVKLAASVEFMHTATLLHDDVVDESELRRGKAAARMVWGNQASVLVGDFLLGQAFKMMVEVGSLDALDILSNAAAIIAEGEVMQLAAAKNTATTEDEYLAVIKAKTAALFSAAAEVGPVIGGRDRAERAAFRSYGTNLGLAFQLIDDALDYGGSSAELGQAGRRRLPRGQDHAAGRALLPARHRMPTAAFWTRVLVEGEHRRRRPRACDRADAQHRAIDDTVERARHFGAVARDALAPFPELGPQGGAARGRRLLHRAGALAMIRAGR